MPGIAWRSGGEAAPCLGDRDRKAGDHSSRCETETEGVQSAVKGGVLEGAGKEPL